MARCLALAREAAGTGKPTGVVLRLDCWAALSLFLSIVSVIHFILHRF